MQNQTMREASKSKKFGDIYPSGQELLEVETFNHALKLWMAVASGIEIIRARHDDPVKVTTPSPFPYKEILNLHIRNGQHSR